MSRKNKRRSEPPQVQLPSGSAALLVPPTCTQCGLSLVPLTTGAFIKRPCGQCGRDTFLYDADPKTGGLRVNKGDQLTISGDLVQRMWKLVDGGRLTKEGLNFLAQRIFFPNVDLVREPHGFLDDLLKEWEDDADAFLNESGIFKGLEGPAEDSGGGAKPETPAFVGGGLTIPSANGEELWERLKADELAGGPNFWAMMSGSIGIPRVRAAIKEGDAVAAAGAAIIATAARAMLLYKVHLEEAVRRGHSVEALRTALTEWRNHKKDDREEFWQQMLTRHSFVLSQVLSTPTVIIGGKAFVGGKGVDNKGGHLADFLTKNEFTRRATLIELKTPTTALLGSEYRGRVYPPSRDLVGAVSQVMTYAASLVESPVEGLRHSNPFDTARPDCLVVIGNTEELADEDHRRSFELYRAELRNVRIVTYDELFRQVEVLLKLFGG